jgi:5'-3' exonuclease
VRVHLVDGTYELFRYYFALPGHLDDDGIEVDAVRGVLGSVLGLLEEGATHVGVATDHIIESFRNDLWPGYKTSAGIDPALLAQFPLLEDALRALGVTVWAMVELEADDALAAAARVGAADARVEQVVICTPDKDLAQCVRGTRVVAFDRRQRKLLDEAGVAVKFGVSPSSIADWLALVGDSADGYPGIPRWGAKSAAAVLARYLHIADVPDLDRDWKVDVRGASALAQSLRERRAEAELYRVLASLRTDAPLPEDLDDLRWRGGRREALVALCRELGEDELVGMVPRWRNGD